jgi:hypothetical protein
MDLMDKANSVKSKDDFIRFIEGLLDNLHNSPGEWENISLHDFLEAMASWVEDMEGYYTNNNLPIPNDINWKVFADILMAAKMYE